MNVVVSNEDTGSSLKVRICTYRIESAGLHNCKFMHVLPIMKMVALRLPLTLTYVTIMGDIAFDLQMITKRQTNKKIN